MTEDEMISFLIDNINENLSKESLKSKPNIDQKIFDLDTSTGYSYLDNIKFFIKAIHGGKTGFFGQNQRVNHTKLYTFISNRTGIDQNVVKFLIMSVIHNNKIENNKEYQRSDYENLFNRAYTKEDVENMIDLFLTNKNITYPNSDFYIKMWQNKFVFNKDRIRTELSRNKNKTSSNQIEPQKSENYFCDNIKKDILFICSLLGGVVAMVTIAKPLISLAGWVASIAKLLI